MSRSTLAALLLLLAISSGNSNAQTSRHVAASGSDAGDCSSAGSPCETVAYALAQASPGDAIHIGPGAFSVAGLVIDKHISLLGAGRDAPGNTVLRAHRFHGQASSRVLTISGDVEVGIADLQIANGVQPNSSGGGLLNSEGSLTLDNVGFRDNQSGANGGGLYNAGESSLSNVVFSGNTANKGGGLYNSGSDPVMDKVVFVQNLADESGGGMYNSGSSPVLTDNDFLLNQAGDNGGAMFNEIGSSPQLTGVEFHQNTAGNGGGMYNLSGSSPVLLDVVFYLNQADNFSGGMHNRDNSSPRLTRVTFIQNSAGASGGGMNNREGTSPHLAHVDFIANHAGEHGGGIYNYTGSSPILENVTFMSNEADLEGGAIRNFSSSAALINAVLHHNAATIGGGMSNHGGTPSLFNVTFHGNIAVERGGGIYNFESSPTLVNTIVWDNSAAQGGDIFNHVLGGDMTLSASYSLFSSGFGINYFVEGAGSINTDFDNLVHDDPLFVDSLNDDFRLSSASPARDAGDPSTDPSLFPGGPGSPLDLDGNPRFQHVAIDIGAHEFQEPTGIIFADGFEDANP